ncbi:hypothetical protein LPW11_02995 [Geomonas sp. RF6]|uniref:hypothetical protein n=1 Tax=Geomonas sp. RF6 TaxID=2897342 RepID=UPI001E37AA26|nr:hypothetical protein [Geomonas sp. RF6]UFS71166.1 hypothetical protein LPW11_02995 [Geomonas sp. RF6]
MDEKETRQDELVVVYRVERRKQKREDLTCEEIMNLARKRGKKLKEICEGPCGSAPRRRKE